MTRLPEIWVCLKQNMNKGALVRLICTEAGISSQQIGRIDVRPGFSFFEVEEKAGGNILPKLESGTYEGKTFNIEIVIFPTKISF